MHSQYEVLADFPLQTNLVLKESQDPFLEGEDKFLDRLNIEALEDTVLLRITSTHITETLEKRVEEMLQVLSARIKIPDSPNQLKVGQEVSEWHVKTNTKFELQPHKVYCQLGGRGILAGEIVNAGSISQNEVKRQILAIE